MSDLVPALDIVNALNTFVGYLDDLSRVAFDGSSTKLRLVVNYASRDYTLRPLTEDLRLHMPSAEVFERVGGEDLDIPTAGVKRLAFHFDLLVHLKAGHKIGLRQILTRSEFSGGDMEHRWKAFQERFVIPLRDDIDSLKRWFEANAEGTLDPGSAFPKALNAVFGVDSEPEPATVSRATPELTALDAAVRAAGLPRKREQNLLVDLSVLQVELSKNAPHPSRLGELVASLRAGGAAIAVAAERCAPDAVALKAEASVKPKGSAPTAQPEPAESAPKPQAESDALETERQALEAERQALETEREAFAVERDAERKALKAEREALKAEREALDALREALEKRSKS